MVSNCTAETDTVFDKVKFLDCSPYMTSCFSKKRHLLISQASKLTLEESDKVGTKKAW